MLRKINSFLWDQPNIDFRLFVVRVAIGLLTVSFVLLGPFDRFHVDGAGLLYRPVGPFRFIPAMGAGTFFTLKYTVVVSAIAWMVGYKTRIANAIFAISYFVFAYYVGHFSTQLFSYITHLNIFAIILCFVDTSRFWSLDRLLEPSLRDRAYSRAQQELASFALAFMQLYVIAFYIQAGGSKLLIGGRDWFLTGATPYYATIVSGTEPGLALTRYPWLYVGVSLFTGFFELGFFLVLVKRLRPFFAAGVICFHFGILLNINIYFYQLSGLVPLLFWFQETRDYRRAIRCMGAYLVLLAALVAMTPLDARPLGTSERDGAQLEQDLASGR
jgi:Vitamin K-dependent gamma-carboxylase